MQFIGIASQAPGADLGAFIDKTGTDQITHLNDETGDLWNRFGTEGRSTFMFVDQDGSFELTTYGSVDKARLVEEVERLIAR